jgi:hypothetical protein
MDHRKVVDGVMFRTRSGCAWRDLPPGYGNWKTVYNRHRRWSGMPPKDIPAAVLAPTVLEVDIRPVKSTGGSIE